MPCRDYMDDGGNAVEIGQLRERLDKLSRIACKALEHIEESGDGLEIMVLKDPEIAEWWSAHKEADRKAREAQEAKRRRAEAAAEHARKRDAIKAKLTPAELKILGVK